MTNRNNVTYHTRACPLCEMTFRAPTTLDLLNRVLVHVETACHPGANIAQTLNELSFQINRLEEIACHPGANIAQALSELATGSTSLSSESPRHFRESSGAFQNALDLGFLSLEPGAPNDVGKFMYMYSQGKHDYFKHRDTRRYVAIPF